MTENDDSPHLPQPFARSERLLHSIAVLRLPWLLVVMMLGAVLCCRVKVKNEENYQ